MYYTGGENEGRQRCDEEAKEEKREAEHTEGVDDAFVLLCYVVHTADPLATIAQCPDALDEMRGLEGQDEKSPGERKCWTEDMSAFTHLITFWARCFECNMFDSLFLF